MAVSSGTTTVKTFVVSPKTTVLDCLLACNGDASGGDVSVNWDLSNYIPTGYKVSVLDCRIQSTNANTDKGCIYVSTGWDCLLQQYIHGGLLAKQLPLYFSTDLNDHILKQPLYLGRCTSTPIFAVVCSPNTDAKTYQFRIKLLLHSA